MGKDNTKNICYNIFVVEYLPNNLLKRTKEGCMWKKA